MSTRTPRPEALYELENSIGYLLNRAANMIGATFSDQLKQHQVSLQAWRILATLSESDNQSLSELADHTGAELSYLSRAVVALEDKGLVHRRPSDIDKRIVLMTLTPAGHALMRKLAPQGRVVEEIGWTDVPKADREVTLRTLRAICRNLLENIEAAHGINKKLTVARRVKKRASENTEGLT